MRYVEGEISGWGRYPRSVCHLYRPERCSSLQALIDSKQEPSWIGRGLGRSYGDAASNSDQGVILCQRLDRFLGFDPDSGRLHCEAGVSLAEILQAFLPRGWFLPVSPGTRLVSAGGAVAADIHGKNHHRDGCFSRHLEQIELWTADGQILTCSPQQHRDVFEATCGGMGLTGFIRSVALRLIPVETAWMRVNLHRTRDLDETLEALQEADEHRYSVAWLDALAKGRSLGRGIVMAGEHASVEELTPRRRRHPLRLAEKRPLPIPFNMPHLLLNRFTVGMFNRLYYRRAPRSPATRLIDIDRFFYPLDALQHWNRLYGKRGFLQYQCLFPPQQSRGGLIELIDRFRRAGHASFLTVLKRFGEEAGPLSFPQPGHTLALDVANTGPELLEFLEEMDQLVLKKGGRVYLAKDARLSPQSFRQMYPRYPEWLAVKRRLDPENRFSSDLSRRLGIGEEAAS